MHCGTPIYNENPRYRGLTILHLGSLDESDKLVPQVNIFCESQLGWLEEIARLTSLDQGIG